MIFHTLIPNLCVVRVHAFVAREFPLLQSKNPWVWFSTSPVQSLQANVENPQEKARPQAPASASWNFESSLAGRMYTENSHPTLRPYPSRVESSFSASAATVGVATSPAALATRAFGFALGRSLLPVPRKRLGLVPDGDQAMSARSSRVPRSCAPARERELAGLVAGDHDDPHPHTQTHPGLGLRRGGRNHQAWYLPELDRAALSFPSHQSIAELPRPTQSPVGGQAPARSNLSTYPPSSRAPRRPPFPSRAQTAQGPGSTSHRIARHTHDRSRVPQKTQPFPSVSKVSRTGSADYDRQRRSYGPKST